jgi:hypothetical protein
MTLNEEEVKLKDIINFDVIKKKKNIINSNYVF